MLVNLPTHCGARTLMLAEHKAWSLPSGTGVERAPQDSGFTPKIYPIPPAGRERPSTKLDRLAELAVHLGHRRVQAEALMHMGQVGHLCQIIPATTQAGLVDWEQHSPAGRQAQPESPLHRHHTSGSQRDASAPVSRPDMEWTHKRRGLAPLFSIPPHLHC